MKDDIYSNTTSNGEVETYGAESLEDEDENTGFAQDSLASFCQGSWVRKKTPNGQTVWASKHCEENSINLFRTISRYKNKHLAKEKADLKNRIADLNARSRTLRAPSDLKENKKEMNGLIGRYKKVVAWHKKLKKIWAGKPIPPISEPEEAILIKCLTCGTSSVAKKMREIRDVLPVYYRWQLEECFQVLQIRLLDLLLAFDFERMRRKYGGAKITCLHAIDNDTIMALWSGFVRESIYPRPILLEVCGIRINRIAVVESNRSVPASASLTLYCKTDSSIIKDQLLLVFFSMLEEHTDDAVEKARKNLPENFRLNETKNPSEKAGRKPFGPCEIKRIEITASSGKTPVCILSIINAKYARIHLQVFDKNLAAEIQDELKEIVSLYMGKNAFGLSVQKDVIATLAKKGFAAIIRELESAKPPEQTQRKPLVFTFNCRYIALAEQDENNVAERKENDFWNIIDKLGPGRLGPFWTSIARCMCEITTSAFVYENIKGVRRKSNLCSQHKSRLKNRLQGVFSDAPEGLSQANDPVEVIEGFLENFHIISSSSNLAAVTEVPADLLAGLAIFMDLFENVYRQIRHSYHKGGFQIFVPLKEAEIRFPERTAPVFQKWKKRK